MQKFSQSLQDFQFECIGDAETDDEINIGKRLANDQEENYINIHVILVNNTISYMDSLP